jgi:hypothetical protein
MAHPKPASCPTRERLIADYKRSLNLYHTTFSALLDTMKVDKTSEQVKHLFDAATAARTPLKAHEIEHDRVNRDGQSC